MIPKEKIDMTYCMIPDAVGFSSDSSINIGSYFGNASNNTPGPFEVQNWNAYWFSGTGIQFIGGY